MHCLFLLFIAVLSTPVFAADSVRVDTTKRRPVVVTADKWLTDATGAGMPTIQLSSDILNRLAPQSLIAVLPLIPGVFVRDYGGLGGLKTFSIRGGSASQALVMIDETRMSSAQNGTIDIGLLPARFVENISVIRGGVCALYGANAMTGAMDVHMRVPESTSVRTFASGGSFDEWRLALGASASIGVVRIGADVESLGTSGSFPFRTDQFGETYTINRNNGDAKSTSGTMRVEADNVGSFTFLGRTTDRGVPGAVVQGNVTSARARLSDDDFIGLLRIKLFTQPTHSLSLVGSARHLEQRYADPDATITGPGGIDVTYLQRDVSFGVVSKSVFSGALNTTRIDANYADLSGESIITDSGSLVLRKSIGISTDWQWDGALGSPLDIRAAIRVDGFSDMGWAVSPLLAMKLAITETFALRASWSYNFRPPTFNELYYLNYGTRSLSPERSQSLDLGVVAKPWSWLAVDVDVFSIMTNNLIVSVPVSPVITSAQNVGAAQSLGMEILARGSWFDGRLIVQWSYTIQNVTDQTGRASIDGTMIPYSVPELASVLVQWDDSIWTGSVQWAYTGYRYAQAGGEHTSLLQPFALIGAQIGVHVRGRNTRADVRLQVDNVLDEAYVVVRGYPMPGRVFRLSTSIVISP